jgi:hypothetical protein
MKRLVLALLISAFAIGPAAAQSCATKAVSKDGKALAGAAKTSSIKKCCEETAVSKDGKPLAGAAKASFLKKCESES